MATKKITKKIINKGVSENTVNQTVTTSVEKEVKKTVPKVDRTKLSNITNIDDLYSLIRDTHNEKNEKKITKEDVGNVMTALKESFQNFAINSDSDKATFILPEIGRFTIFVVKEHDSINPKTMEKVHVPTKKRIRFKAFPRFNDTVNGVESKK